MDRPSEKGGKDCRKEESKEEYSIVDIYIGVFFDGTNNNKMQVALGRKFRQQEEVSSEAGFKKLDERNISQLIDNSKNTPSRMSRLEDKSVNEEVASILKGNYAKKLQDKYQNDNSQLASYTNVAILELFYKTDSTHYSFYVEGAGSHVNYDRTTDPRMINGLAFGTGEFGVCEKVFVIFEFIKNFVLSKRQNGIRYKLHFDVFGFSRGATAARIFNYVVYCDKVGSNNEAKNIDLAKKSKEIIANFKPSKGIESKEVEYLGIFDTVSSMGVVYSGNVADYGLWATNKCRKVLHICGMDEMRVNFALTDIQSSIDACNGLELWLPGCHTDIGGGATIGRDDVKIINKVNFALLKRTNNNLRRILKLATNIIEQPADQIEEVPESLRNICANPSDNNTRSPITRETLIDMGWIDSGKELQSEAGLDPRIKENSFIETDINFSMFRYVTHGYSNVALKLAIEGAKTQRKDMFDFEEKLFPIPSDSNVKSIYNQACKKLSSSGRFSIIPPNYAELRRNYLHYSANEREATRSLSDRREVNRPYVQNIDDIQVMTRQIFVGVEPVTTGTSILINLVFD